MARIRTIRYFHQQPISVNDMQLVLNQLNGFDNWQYTVSYLSEDIQFTKFNDVKEVAATRGRPRRVRIVAKSSGGRFARFDATHPQHISIEYYSNQLNPDVEIGRIQTALSLRPLLRIVETAFIAHGFDATGKQYASEVRLFLETLGIGVETGERFAPSSIPNKVKDRIEACDIFVAILSPQNDHTWIIQETMYADSMGKSPFLIVDTNVNYKPGMLGDNEYIPFQPGFISESFVKILQGVNAIRGIPLKPA